MMERNEIIYDIETRGLSIKDGITVIGFKEFGGEHTIIYQNPTEEEYSGEDFVASTSVNLVECDSEKEVLEEMKQYIEENEVNIKPDSELVGFENNNFDDSYIRTRAARLEVELFGDIDTIDIHNLIKYECYTKRVNLDSLSGLVKDRLKAICRGLNLSDNGIKDELVERIEEYIEENNIDEEEIEEVINNIDGEDISDYMTESNTLETALDSLTKEDYDNPNIKNPIDSDECPEEFDKGNIDKVIQHNIADLEMTEVVIEKLKFIGNKDPLELENTTTGKL